MPRKIKRKRKLKGFFYHKKRLILVFTFGIFALAGFLILRQKPVSYKDCANNISCISELSGQYDENNQGEFEGKKITGPAIAAAPHISELAKNVLGEATQDAKRIYVDLNKQRLYAFENNNLIYDFPISSGKPGTPTPTGDFRVWIKLRYTRMQGGSGANYYNLPNVPYTMYFYNEKVAKHRGYGIHGAYWHNNFGRPMSHGCVNMKEADVAQLYAWANPPSIKNVTYASAQNPGTLITIYGSTPTQ